MAGWQAWDVALRCAGQLRTAQLAVIGVDMNAAIRIGESLGYNPTGLVELLPACESGMVSAINAKVNEGLK